MEYEIDFLPVGDAGKSGDAIALRYLPDSGAKWIVGVVDGGTQDSGGALCEHVRKFYKTDDIDFVICTHPEQDHASGLSVVLDEMHVARVLMHRPWEHVDYVYPRVDDSRVTKNSLRQRLIEGHPYAYAIEKKCIAPKIPIIEPFVGTQHGVPNLTIVGPTAEYYLSCLLNFRSIQEITDDGGIGLGEAVDRIASAAVRFVKEWWNSESLVEPAIDAVSSENNSGVISLFTFGSDRILLTADVGVPALAQAIDNADEMGITPSGFSLFQVPHHGSKRNVGPSVLNKFLGRCRAERGPHEYCAMVSASKEGEPKHPSKRVVNALIRRGAQVVATKGGTKWYHSYGVPDRGWPAWTPLPFYDEVEEDDSDAW